MTALHSNRTELAAHVADWRDRICSAFVDLECENIDQDGFFGTVASQSFAGLQFARVHSTKQKVVRSGARLAQSAQDDFLLSIQLSGQGYVRQAGREAWQKPGDMTLYDTTRPYELAFDGRFRQLILTLPRARMLQAIPLAENLTAIGINRSHGTSRLATGYIGNLANQCGTLETNAQAIAGETVFDMLTLAFSSVKDFATPHRTIDLLYHRAIELIDHSLTETALCPRHIANHLGVSIRYLNAAFARHNSSVSRSIWLRRLHRAFNDLQNPAFQGRSITDIAFGLGFNDSAHFTRTFKSAFGETPSALRRRALLAH